VVRRFGSNIAKPLRWSGTARLPISYLQDEPTKVSVTAPGEGSTHRIAVAIHSSLLASARDESAHESDVELTEPWNLTDPHIMAVLLAMRTDLDAGSPAGRLYGESLASALAVYLLNRYAVQRYAPVAYRGGLPGYRLRRVLDYVGNNLADDLTLSELTVACMSPHYFAKLFRQSTGFAPRRFVPSR
jgi:AraC family transcriptional regulator